MSRELPRLRSAARELPRHSVSPPPPQQLERRLASVERKVARVDRRASRIADLVEERVDLLVNAVDDHVRNLVIAHTRTEMVEMVKIIGYTVLRVFVSLVLYKVMAAAWRGDAWW